MCLRKRVKRLRVPVSLYTCGSRNLSGRPQGEDSNVHKSTAASPQMSHCFEHCTRGSLWHDHDSGDEVRRQILGTPRDDIVSGIRTHVRRGGIWTRTNLAAPVIHYQLHFSVEPFFGRCRFHSRLRCERQSRHRSSSRGEVRFCGARDGGASQLPPD